MPRRPSLRFSAVGLSVLLTTRVRTVLVIASALPAATASLLFIVFAPSIAGAYLSDILFYVCLALVQLVIFVVAGTINYRLIIMSSRSRARRRWYIYRFKKTLPNLTTNWRIAIVWSEGLIASLILFHVALHVTNPYAGFNLVEMPYVTDIRDGALTVNEKFRLHVASGPLADGLGYYKSGFLIVQNAWFGSYPAPSRDADGIIDDIHALRFDPTKPYLISGDQFSVLYPRNLGVFYNSLLDHRTAHSESDWQNRQRIYLQSALYALDAFSSARKLTTTIVPIGPRTVALTQVHPGSIASDSLYGILYAFDDLENGDGVQSGPATRRIVGERADDLRLLLDIYLSNVRDERTGLVKRGIHLASARDGVVRDSSFYDNVILWKTLQLADALDIRRAGPGELDALRATIMATFWQRDAGYFRDDQKSTDFSSDWLIALPTGFLSTDDSSDSAKIISIIGYTKSHRLDQPLPIRYSATNDDNDVPLAVKKFVPNYGGDAIWSYWGSQYISLLGVMYHRTGDQSYRDDALRFIDSYRQKIEQVRGFPETFDTDGNFLQYPFYKSIRQTGWVVQFEQAEVEVGRFRQG